MSHLAIEWSFTRIVERLPSRARKLMCGLSRVLIKSAFLFISLIASHAHAESQAKPHFVWKQGSGYQSLEKVRFLNGEVAIVSVDPKPPRRGRSPCLGQRLEIGKEGDLRPHVCDGTVTIHAAYPTASNAVVAVVSANCGGTMCGRYSDYFVLFIGDQGLRSVAVGMGFDAPSDRPTTYEFWFDGSRIARSVVWNFFDGKQNELGDLVPSTRRYAMPGYYLDSRFKQQYAKFLGAHPESVLSDVTARKEIVRSIEPASFRAYRSAMSGPGSSTVSNGRFLVMNACRAHSCPSEFGSVVLDGLTGEIWLLRFEPETKSFSTAGTRPLDASTVDEWVQAVDTQDKFELRFDLGALKVDWK